MAKHIEQEKYKFVVDVGSNDGILIRPLKKLGIKCVGVDPSENVSEIAKNGFETFVGFYTSDVVAQILKKYGKPDLICASSVFTHFEDPNDFFDFRKPIK